MGLEPMNKRELLIVKQLAASSVFLDNARLSRLATSALTRPKGLSNPEGFAVSLWDI